MLTENGEVYTFGRNDYGQLGVGETVNSAGATMYLNSRVPKKVLGLDDVKIIKVACGYNHCLALSGSTNARKCDTRRDVLTILWLDKGEVYAWGRNTYSQLGNKKLELTKNYSQPVKVSFNEPVLDICSKKHWNMATTGTSWRRCDMSIFANVLFRSQSLLRVGQEQGRKNCRTKCRHDCSDHLPRIRRQEDRVHERWLLARYCRYWYVYSCTFVVSDLTNEISPDDGACYTWGFVDFGKLGRAGVTAEPGRVEGVLLNRKVLQVAAGSNSCLILTQPE